MWSRTKCEQFFCSNYIFNSEIPLFRPIFNQGDSCWVTVWHGKKTGGKPTFLGQYALPLSSLPIGKFVDMEVPLSPRKSKEKVSGYIRIAAKYDWRWDKTDLKPDPTVKIFGTSVEELYKREQPPNFLPSYFMRLYAYFLENEKFLKKEYIFSRCPPVRDFAMLLLQLNDGEYVSYQETGPYTTSSVLLHTLKELPDPLFSYALYEKLLALPGENLRLYLILVYSFFTEMLKSGDRTFRELEGSSR